MRKQFALSALLLLSSVTSAQEAEYALSCSGTPLLFPKQVLSTDFENVNVSADYSEGTNGNYLLTGNASLNSSQYHLSADEIKIEKGKETSVAKGNVKFQSKKIMLNASNAALKKQGETTHTSFKNVNYHYPDTKINGKAKKVINDGSVQTFDTMTYSLCPIGNTDWQMKADKVTLNQKTNRGIARNITIEFLGVPIFYSPHHEWTLKGRSSGFLAPSIASYTESDASSKNGYQIRIPYYFNIAADRDFLLTLNQLTTRGSIVEGKYRQLLDKGRIEVEAHYLNKDKIEKDNRWLLNTKLDLFLNNKIKLNVATNRVSDPAYLKEVAHKNTDKTALMSSANITYEDKKQGLAASVFIENEQLLSGDAEYTRTPEIILNKKVEGLDGREANFSVTSTQFKHSAKTQVAGDVNNTGLRTHVQADFSRNIKTNSYSIQPKFTISKTKYLMDNISDQDRSIYSFGLDSKLFFEKNTTIFGKGMTQTLVPRLTYNYTPGKDQSALQNFDSKDTGDSYENLFLGKKFTGLDRINKVNDVVVGLESSFINTKSGETYLTLKIAQAQHLNDTTTDIKGNFVRQKNHSNIAAGADISLDKFTFNNATQYDPDTKSTVKNNSTLSYTSTPKKFISLTHENNQGARSAGIFGAYPITSKVHLFGGVNHSLSNSINHRKTAGLAYESCCWAVRLAHFNEYTATGTYDKVTRFELVLKGLASSDSALANRLENEIPNYLADLNK